MRSERGRGWVRAAVGALWAALALLAAPGAWAEDASTADVEAIGGFNVSELREQIREDRLACSGGAPTDALWWVAALGAVAALGLRRRGLPER